ncbi:MAG: hypothetical protein UV73_C0008G0018 [Candidatus Gottesmanbacteria bacterium GW2011_GWA2_43_14]|uniref:Uncharacterized protein n=1 Tax=Candidatus Gottesmanbacteria bacterium GW2011_GWA2_43_14 TaxID=1618443 RepID=A0A0G1GF53_9BACT|nr:MAG: hypothetical protein UV73_C0008G0018 [Candidatus Gottesmanbacteria bacterium GW2011_GWA2_43_14]
MPPLHERREIVQLYEPTPGVSFRELAGIRRGNVTFSQAEEITKRYLDCFGLVSLKRPTRLSLLLKSPNQTVRAVAASYLSYDDLMYTGSKVEVVPLDERLERVKKYFQDWQEMAISEENPEVRLNASYAYFGLVRAMVDPVLGVRESSRFNILHNLPFIVDEEEDREIKAYKIRFLTEFLLDRQVNGIFTGADLSPVWQGRFTEFMEDPQNQPHVPLLMEQTFHVLTSTGFRFHKKALREGRKFFTPVLDSYLASLDAKGENS